MEDKEEWKIIDINKNYEVSSFGNVRTVKTGRILKLSSKGGYGSVGLSSIKPKTYSIHQLVAKAFILNPNNKPQVNHLDKNGLNNNLSNLEWVTNEENAKHRSNGVKQTTNQNLEIYKINSKTDEIIEKYNSIEDAANSIINENSLTKLKNVCSGISMTVNGKYNTSYGYKWEKIEQNSIDNEEWREIIIDGKNMKGYSLSNLGRFKNTKGIIMKNYKPHHSGYIYVRVNKKKYGLHQLVGQTFIPNTENRPFVNHIDGNKINNYLNNLEWATCAENNLHNHKIGLIKCYSRKIIQYDLEMNKIKQFNKILDASKELNICYSSIKAVLYKKQNTAGGFIWKYLD
jgi:hypothetical protein